MKRDDDIPADRGPDEIQEDPIFPDPVEHEDVKKKKDPVAITVEQRRAKNRRRSARP